jgi:two-component sensor histidine kinase
MNEFQDRHEHFRSLTLAIMESIREPLLALDGDFKVLFASGSFYCSFQLRPEDTRDHSLFTLDDGTWDIPALRSLLEGSISDQVFILGFKIEKNFPRIGRRIFLLHAQRASYEDNRRVIVLAFEDVTERRAIEEERTHLQVQTDDLLRQKETLIEMAPYLSNLCTSLADSMIGGNRSGMLKVVADYGKLVSAEAVSLGLIVTELVINALKYAFPNPTPSDAVIVRYEMNGTDWKLSISDNGIGRTKAGRIQSKGGLGTSLVRALAHQLVADIETTRDSGGMAVAITHTIFVSRLSQIA